MWDLPGPGLEPVSPALAGGFLTTVPSGKPLPSFLKDSLSRSSWLTVFFFQDFKSCLLEDSEEKSAVNLFFFLILFIYLFIIYGCVGSSFLCEGFL